MAYTADPSRPRFSEFKFGPWEGQDGRLTSTMYGLSRDGDIYVFRNNRGWVEVQQELDERHR